MAIGHDAEEAILRFLKIEKTNDVDSAFRIAVDSVATIAKETGIHDLKELPATVNFSVLGSLLSMSGDMLYLFEKAVQERVSKITADTIHSNQIQVQRLLQPSVRKKLAAYYTKEAGLNAMSQIAREYGRIHDSPLSMCDPFIGSGLTLSEVITRNPELRTSKVWGIEPHPLSALVAYSAILHAVKGDARKVEVFTGDAFKIVGSDSAGGGFPTADVILTNPPFTRWEILDKNERLSLTGLVNLLGYDEYVSRRQLNLQVLSLFVMDYILRDHGLLVSVLPASTFYTIYGETAKRLLNDKYQTHALIENGAESSFSIDSEFKELILVATKDKATKDAAFITLDKGSGVMKTLHAVLGELKPSYNNINWVNTSRIPSPWKNNWLSLFGNNKIRDLLSGIFTKAFGNGTLGSWYDAVGKKRIARGVEMYGPDFFFVPNRFWKVADEKVDSVILQNDREKTVLDIDREFLTLAFRKPEHYTKSVAPSVAHHLVAIPPKPFDELPESLKAYIKWGIEARTAVPAFRSFGKFWYSHVYRQLKTKKPFGRVFLPDKVDPSFRNRAVFSCYSDQPLTASKNFYIVNLRNFALDKAICAWFNCTIFLAYFLVSSRKISDRWSRFLEEDYLRMPIPNVDKIDQVQLEEVNKAFDLFAESDLPILRSQITTHPREQLDSAILNALGVENEFLEELYDAVIEHFEGFDTN
jgi:hypothetical protein